MCVQMSEYRIDAAGIFTYILGVPNTGISVFILAVGVLSSYPTRRLFGGVHVKLRGGKIDVLPLPAPFPIRNLPLAGESNG